MYTIRVLSEKDFEKLPYKKVKTSLGLADQKNGVAYVRDTGYGDITKQTINHELDELIAKTSPHEEDGIRYKSLASFGAGAGGGALSNILGGALGKSSNSLLSGAGNLIQKSSPLISAGAGALFNNKGNPIQGALQGFAGGGAGQGVIGGIKGLTQPGGTFGKALSNFGSGGMDALKRYGSEIPGFGAGGKFSNMFSGASGAQNPPMSMEKSAPYGVGNEPPMSMMPTTPSTAMGGNSPLNPANAGTSGGGIMDNLSKLFSGGGGAPKTTASGADGEGGGILDNFKKALPGLATTQIGQMLAPKVETPDFGGITNDLRSMMQTGGDPIAKDLGMTELTRGLETPLGTPPDSAFTAGDLQADKELTDKLKTFDNAWKAIRPGADFSQDSEYQAQRQKIINEHSEQRVAARDEMSFQYTQQQLQQKYNYMVQALNIDQYQMQQYVQLAQMDINQLMLEYGVDVQTATDFKQLFGDLGQMQLQGAMPQEQPQYSQEVR